LTARGLYLHVPFCRCRCDWCAFASEAGEPRPEAYLDRITAQLASVPPDRRWATVYVGGGTPSLLSPRGLDRLLAAAEAARRPGAETTVEANPESLTGEHLAVMAARGVTRLSLGIQSFQEDLLARHGRPTRAVHLAAARRLVRDWPGRLSLDLIAGLAGQTEAGQRRDLDEALDWGAGHLSFYPLSVEPGTPLARKVARGGAGLPPSSEAERWWIEGRERIEAAGLPAYEVSNFARPGQESEHNRRYWALEPWDGFGPSATGLGPLPGGGLAYRTEVPRLAGWLAGEEPEVETPSALETAKDRLLAGLRRREGVDAGLWTPLLPRTVQGWSPVVRLDGGRLFLSGEAFLRQDAFLRDAFAELDGRPEFR